jgi:hypothetical protein
MDLSQALLCLITFNNPTPTKTDSAIEQPSTVCVDQASDSQQPKFDLQFHQQKVGVRGEPMVTGATEPLFLE